VRVLGVGFDSQRLVLGCEPTTLPVRVLLLLLIKAAVANGRGRDSAEANGQCPSGSVQRVVSCV
jgi:hypothetical protein